MSSKTLVVDDDPTIAEISTVVTEHEDFDIIVVDDGPETIEAAERGNPDLILLGLMLSGMSSVDVYHIVRETSAAPIVMLTAKIDTIDMVLSLESGAGNYITKPSKPKELMVRVRARLCYREDSPSETLEASDLIIDMSGHAMSRDGREISLTPLGFDLLHAPISCPKQVLSRDELLEEVWGYQHAPDTQLVNVHIQRLCPKIELDPGNSQIVLTVCDVGYKTGS